MTKPSQLFLLLCLLFLVSCGNVSMVSSLAKDDYSFMQDPAEKVLLIALTGDDANRRNVENTMKSKLVKKIPEVQTSYDIIKKGESTDKLLNFIRENNFTHIITMHLAGVQKEIKLKSATKTDYYSSFPEYYRDYGVYLDKTWGTAYEAAAGSERIEYAVETNVYSLKDKGLVYSALTSSRGGTGFDKTLNATLSKVKNDMKKSGLFK